MQLINKDIKNIKVDWRKLLYFFSKRYKTAVNKNADLIRDGISCLIAADPVLLKEGTKIEFAGKIWNHALNRSVLGLKMLLLAY